MFHMVGGSGETSYASNSKFTEKVLLKARPMVKASLTDVYRSLRPEKLVVADLGCSCGPTTFMVISEVMDTISSACQQLDNHCSEPEILYFLNDLPENDFNTIFKKMSLYEKKMREEKGRRILPYYIMGTPGSFYGRLFPSESIHFFHSSYSVHWLSQVPKDIVDNTANRRNIYIAKTSPREVQSSYLAQFQQDFSAFLKFRSTELISGGQMVITLLGRSNCLYDVFELLAEALNSMINEGTIEEQKLDAFDLPIYAPIMEDVKEVIRKEGSFCLIHEQTFYLNWDPSDEDDEDFVKCRRSSGEYVAKCMRSVCEPILVSQFGEAIIDDLFSRYAENLAGRHSGKKIKLFTLAFSLKKIK